MPILKLKNKEQFLKSMRIVARRYAPRECEVVWLVNQKELIIQLTACALNLNADAENIVLQIVAKDITELKESQRLLESKNKELEEMNKKLEEISITDALTNLFNRRHFDKALELEKSRSERMKHKFTILIMDIDKFKIYNDTNGHPAGDALLKEFSKVLKTCVRDTDLAARYGGEEFVVLCPETDSTQALVVAERIRSSMENHPFLHREKQPFGFVSVSIGLATFNEHGKASGHEIYEMADKALYEAKKQRNSIKVYST